MSTVSTRRRAGRPGKARGGGTESQSHTHTEHAGVGEGCDGGGCGLRVMAKAGHSHSSWFEELSNNQATVLMNSTRISLS